MRSEQYQNVGHLYHAALDLPRENRSAFLDGACEGDQELRQEVHSLLEAHDDAGAFIERPALDAAAQWIARQEEADTLSGRIGAYEVLSLIGRGGMGEVYLAHVTRLGRQVALKMLPSQLTSDLDAVRRFEQEARAASSLNHPNIVTIYEIGEIHGRRLLAMEFVEGQSLDAMLGRPVGLGALARMGGQLAQALSVAHAAGIVHRDIKPENIIVRADGYVKVLDFGLARLVAAPTIVQAHDARHATSPSVILGTPRYMSPEQVRGEPATSASDVFSLGVVLYELATGTHPFEADSTFEMLHAVTSRAAPKPTEWRPDMPMTLERLLLRMLEKQHTARPTADEVEAQLTKLAAALSEPAPYIQTIPTIGSGFTDHIEESPTDALRGQAKVLDFGLAAKLLPAASARPSIGWWKWAAVLVVIAVAGSAWSQWRSGPPADAARDDYVQLTNFADSVTSPAVSPDGTLLTFIRGISSFQGAGQIYVKALPDGEPRQLTHDGLNKMSPVFSPDGSRIAYTTVDDSNEWDTWDVPVLGGQPRKWLPNASGLVWVDKQNVLFSEKIRDSKGNHMKIVAATENRAGAHDLYVPLPKGAMAHRSFPSPDGRWVVVVEMDDRGDWLPCRVVPMDGSSTGRQVGPSGAPCWFAAWSPDGKWMYLNSLMGRTFQILRQRFSERGALSTPEPITSGPMEHEGISLTTDGRSLITAMGLKQSSVWLVASQGKRQSSQEGHAEHATFTPDGQARQISLEGYAKHPKFTSDGKRLLYLTGKSASGPKELWMAELDTGRNEPVLPGFRMNEYQIPRVPYDISPDGQHVVVEVADAEGRDRLWLAPLDRSSPPRQIPNVEGHGPLFLSNAEVVFRGREGDYGFAYRVRTDGTELRKASNHPVISTTGLSPDGQWLVVYARPSEEKAGGTLALPLGGGSPIEIVGRFSRAAWSPNGRQLLLSEGVVGTAGITYIVPLPRGEAFPVIPVQGLLNTKAIAGLPGVQVIDSADVASGPTPGVFAVSRVTVQLNVYRFPIP
jgi:Tol biopolymer transport system component/predicted Ser/Thr protein kinase